MTLPTTNDWTFINTFAGWLSAIGTLLAVIVSLWLARRDARIRLRVTVGIRKIFFERKVYEKPGEEPDFVVVAVTNIGRRVAIVTGLLWKNQLFPRRYLFQMPGEAPFSAQLPAKLQDGEEADFVVPWSAFAANDTADFRRLIPKPEILMAFFLRILIRTSTGEMFAARPEKEFRKRLLSFVQGKA